jgi:hypothetical protein
MPEEIDLNEDGLNDLKHCVENIQDNLGHWETQPEGYKLREAILSSCIKILILFWQTKDSSALSRSEFDKLQPLVTKVQEATLALKRQPNDSEVCKEILADCKKISGLFWPTVVPDDYEYSL